MRKIISFNMVTLDGFFEGLNHDIYWHRVDDEFNQFAVEQLNSAGGLIFGRITYEMMASYWPTGEAVKNDPIVTGQMNAIPKIVFSRTLNESNWNNTRLVKESAETEIIKLKQETGKDFFIFGSAVLSSALARAGLIDEFRMILNPVVLGNGKALFQGVTRPLNFKLLKTKLFQNGNVLLYYPPEHG